MSNYALILAGGEGTRFAPLSTPECPKQFLALVGEKSLIRQTADRIQPVIPASHWWSATNARYVQLVSDNLPELPHTHIIGETHKKNTAPAIALAAMCMHHRDPNAVMAILPSDHVILNEAVFQDTLSKALAFASSHDVLVTLGITPTWASSDYGYIERGVAETSGIFRVKRFVEKPTTQIAEGYLQTGTYSWNSGMFVWKASVILEEIHRYLPELHNLFDYLVWEEEFLTPESIATFFAAVQSVSIDYGILEKSDRVVVIPAEMGWNDVGTWGSLKRLADSGAVTVRSDVQNFITQFAGV